MNKTFNSLKEVYDNSKDIIIGEFKYFEKENEKPYITWQASKDLSAYITGDSIMIGRGDSEVYSELFDTDDYSKIYDLIMKYNGEFRRNPDYGKKQEKEEKVLLYITLTIILIIIIAVIILESK